MNTLAASRPAPNRAVQFWIGSVCLLILAMVAVGGITRLTGSGLSIVDWNPIMGAIPPLGDGQWQEAFSRYQQSPQYQLVNHGMTLAQFKGIFFWEYLHRLLGRAIGVVFFVPWAWFLARRELSRELAVRLVVGFFLGGLQGALGWFMVKSGLVDRPSVSHYRLAAHLSLALIVFSYLFWIWLDGMTSPPELSSQNDRGATARLRRAFAAITALLGLQIIYGAFTAGLKAGFGYNTFPKMMGQWFPSEDFFRLAPSWLNVLENPAAVQFVHRTLAWTLLFSILGFLAWSRRFALSTAQRRAIRALSLLICAQFALGVATLLLVVPVSLATIHQVGASLVLAGALWVNHALRKA